MHKGAIKMSKKMVYIRDGRVFVRKYDRREEIRELKRIIDFGWCPGVGCIGRCVMYTICTGMSAKGVKDMNIIIDMAKKRLVRLVADEELEKMLV